MDAVLPSVVAGVIVAVVSAFAAYYFGGVREKQKQKYERQQEEQRRQEEQEEELNKRRGEILIEIKSRASVIVEHTRSLAEIYLSLAFILRFYRPTLRFEMSVEKCAEIEQLRDSLASERHLLRKFYERQTPYLTPTQRELYEAFDKDFDRRYTPYLSTQEAFQTIRQDFTLDEDDSRLPNMLVRNLGPNARRSMKLLESHVLGLPEAAGHARHWDFAPIKLLSTRELRD
jgi:hypothetical protein